MNDNLSFKEEKLFNFLFSKIIELQTETVAQKIFLKALHNHLHPDDIDSFEKMEKVLQEQKALIFQDRAQNFVAELKAISDDFDGMIESLINPK